MLWGKLFKKAVLMHGVRRVNILAANKIVFAEDVLLMTASLTFQPTVTGLDYIGYRYFANVNGMSQKVETIA